MDLRRQVHPRIDPLAAKQQEMQGRNIAKAKAMRFAECTETG